jgi:hypothetical protein
MATRMQQRRGTEQQWTNANPVLAAGEIGFETDTNRFKMGDGQTQWSDLTYFIDESNLSGSLEDYIPLTDKGAPNGVATLDADGQIPVEQLNNIIDGADEALDTLRELSAAIGDNAGFIETFNALNTRVETIDTGLGTLTDTVDSLGNDLSGTNENFSQLNSNLEDLTETVSTLDSEKAPKADPTFTGTVVLPSTTSIGDVTATELAHLAGVSSGIQDQIDAKLDVSVAGTTYAPLVDAVLTGDVVLPSTTTIGDVSSAEIAYLEGTTSSVQDQLDAKAPIADPIFTGTVSGVTKAMVGLGNVDNTSDADKPVSTAQATAIETAKSEAIADATAQVNAVIASAPAALDTLEELAAALGDDANFATTVTNSLSEKAPIADPTFTGTVTVSASGVAFSDGTQTKAGVPSISTISQKTGSYTLSSLAERDSVIEIGSSTAATLTIPTDSAVNYPVGTSIDVIQTGSGQVTIVGASGVTVNSTPGLKIRTQWSTITLLKRAADTWLAFGDLSA